jgi:hypothetical protein
VLGGGGWSSPHLGHLTPGTYYGRYWLGPRGRSGRIWRGQIKIPAPYWGSKSPEAKAARHRTDTSFTYSLFPYDKSVSSVLTVTVGLPPTVVIFSCLPIKLPVRLIRVHSSNCVMGGSRPYRLATSWMVRGSNSSGVKFSVPIQTGPEEHPASCKCVQALSRG